MLMHIYQPACVCVCVGKCIYERVCGIPRAQQICKVTPRSQSGAGLEHEGESVSASGKSQHLNPQSAAVVCMCAQRSHGSV